MKKNHPNDETPIEPLEQSAPAAEASADQAPPPQPESAEEVAPISEANQLKDRLLRLQADFDNFRKRSARERAEWQVFALEQIIQDLLPVVDHYELGLATAIKNQTAQPVVDGLKLVYEQLINVLKKNGVAQVRANPGEAFDPHKQEAISHIPSEEHAADIVIAETRRGYMLGEKMIRPLQVVVSSGPGPASDGA
jgi:molecular chaperone GrpE